MKPITFTDIKQELPSLAPPKPATEALPDWYKKMANYFGKEIGGSTDKEVYLSRENMASAPQTMKRCMPLFDAMTVGYVFETLCDVQVTQEEGAPFFIWPQNYDVLMFHGAEQTKGNPNMKDRINAPKWTNPWAIKTPPGYSCLIVPPLNNQNNIFEVFSGVVDTDGYTERIHFPFRLLDWEWEGVIPAGTPIAQVIPFKRDNFKMEIGGEKEREESIKVGSAHRRFFYNAYRNMWWNRKSYK